MSANVKVVLAKINHPLCGGCGQVFGADWELGDFQGHRERAEHPEALLVLPQDDPSVRTHRTK